MKNWVLREVIDRSPNGFDNWRVVYEKEDGTLHVHDFPKDTMEWRAAEYGIDPSDMDTLLDIVLHEPYIDRKNDAAAAAGYMAKIPAGLKNAGKVAPVELHSAATIDDAREAHLLRIQDVKNRVVDLGLNKAASKRGLVAESSPLDIIKQNSPMRPEYVEAKRELVQKQREAVRRKPEPAVTEIDKMVMRNRREA